MFANGAPNDNDGEDISTKQDMKKKSVVQQQNDVSS